MSGIFRNTSILVYIPIIVLLFSGSILQSPLGISANEQYLFFMKVLSYNRNLNQQVGDTMKIGIVYQEKNRASMITHQEFEAAVKQSDFNKINGISISCISIPYGDNNQLLRDIKDKEIDVLYISPLRSVSIKEMLKICRGNNLITITAQADYCAAGVSTGLELVNGRVRIVINLNGAKEEGSDYSSQLLKLALIKQ